jgi:hypothetical protein
MPAVVMSRVSGNWVVTSVAEWLRWRPARQYG